MTSTRIVLVSLAVFLVTIATAYAATQVVTLQPGDVADLRCSTKLIGKVSGTQATVSCATAVLTATPTATRTPTRTVTPVPLTATPTLVPTATNTPSGSLAGQPCPASIHDAITTAGPDGATYATWHPAVDSGTSCLFGHEHGPDPRTSNADNTMPAFGYVNAVAGVVEPHVGFKVFIIPNGLVTENGTVSTGDYRIVFHMGTGAVGRYTTRFHSAEYDYVARDGSGREFHVQGMFDTNEPVGSTCDLPRRGGRDFSTVGCNDPYEIWTNVHLSIIHPNDPYTDAQHVRLFASGAVAVFDPITTRDPADNNRLLYSLTHYQPSSTIDPLSAQSPYRGCRREVYGGPNYFNNAGRPTVYYTDAYGVVQLPAGPGPGRIEQLVSAVASTNNVQFKFRQDFCSGGVHAPN